MVGIAWRVWARAVSVYRQELQMTSGQDLTGTGADKEQKMRNWL